jgi:flagellar biosynthesis protein
MTARPQRQLAVALHYEKGEGAAPTVVARGHGDVGDAIIATAKEHGVPIEQNAGLAAALSDVEIGEEIPVELYRAVAEVLIFIMRLSGKIT